LEPVGASAALVFSIALAIGMIAQVVARHIQMPGIVILLGCGVLFGPDVLGIVRPDALGPAVQTIVGIAVAIILFEGGLNLDLRRLRAEALVIRRLVTIGAIITGVGGTAAAYFLMGWELRLSILFGTLVIVTGPTVVTPLLRRLRVKQSVSTILEAEGVLIDPIGAIIAVVALEFLYPLEGSAAASTLARPAIVLAGGGVLGLVGGIAIALLLRPKRLVPEGLENVLVLSLVVVLFETSESLIHESGLAAVVAAGMVVGNMRTRVLPHLLEFKEQLTVLMIGLLFVLLAADVRIAEVQSLGWPAVWTVAALLVVVRPVQAWVCTVRASLTAQERAFIATLAPRGIVAAAVASLFAETITARGLEGGMELRALVFVVIASTVTIHGLTGGFVARMLGVRRATASGYAILGANGLSLALARLLREEQPNVILIDSNPDRVLSAQRNGFRSLYGQGLHASVLARAELDSKLGCMALTPNEEVKLLWANKVRAETRAPRVYVTLRAGPRSIPAENVHEAGGVVLFGHGVAVTTWSQRLENADATIERWRLTGKAADEDEERVDEPGDAILMLTVRRPGRIRAVDDETAFRERDESDIAIAGQHRQAAEAWLRQNGWVPVDLPEEKATQPATA
jgi:NhaP-type Na+/H+ or K+/H+ antiporter